MKRQPIRAEGMTHSLLDPFCVFTRCCWPVGAPFLAQDVRCEWDDFAFHNAPAHSVCLEPRLCVPAQFREPSAVCLRNFRPDDNRFFIEEYVAPLKLSKGKCQIPARKSLLSFPRNCSDPGYSSISFVILFRPNTSEENFHMAYRARPPRGLSYWFAR
jgi:hypothetical protein